MDDDQQPSLGRPPGTQQQHSPQKCSDSRMHQWLTVACVAMKRHTIHCVRRTTGSCHCSCRSRTAPHSAPWLLTDSQSLCDAAQQDHPSFGERMLGASLCCRTSRQHYSIASRQRNCTRYCRAQAHNVLLEAAVAARRLLAAPAVVVVLLGPTTPMRWRSPTPNSSSCTLPVRCQQSDHPIMITSRTVAYTDCGRRQRARLRPTQSATPCHRCAVLTPGTSPRA